MKHTFSFVILALLVASCAAKKSKSVPLQPDLRILPGKLHPAPNLNNSFWYALFDTQPGYMTLWATPQYLTGLIYLCDQSLPVAIPWYVGNEAMDKMQIYTLNGYGYYLVWDNLPNTKPKTYIGLFDTTQSRINGQYFQNGITYSFDATLSVVGPYPEFPAGTYSILANGYPADLNYSTVSIQFGWHQIPSTPLEPLEAITKEGTPTDFYQGSRYLAFKRDFALQNYSSIIGSNTDHLDGKFHATDGNYPFNGVLSYAKGATETTRPLNLGGTYVFLSGGWGGLLTITSSYTITGQWTTAVLNTNTAPVLNSNIETMAEISFSYQHGAWYIQFYRTAPTQIFYAVMDSSGNSLHGSCLDLATNQVWHFDAARW